MNLFLNIYFKFFLNLTFQMSAISIQTNSMAEAQFG